MYLLMHFFPFCHQKILSVYWMRVIFRILWYILSLFYFRAIELYTHQKSQKSPSTSEVRSNLKKIFIRGTYKLLLPLCPKLCDKICFWQNYAGLSDCRTQFSNLNCYTMQNISTYTKVVYIVRTLIFLEFFSSLKLFDF